MNEAEELTLLQPEPVKTTKSWGYLLSVLGVLLVFGGLAMLVWLVAGTNQDKSSETTPALPLKGNIAPDFSLPSLDGKNVQLSDFAGQVVVVNLWATWCPPCRAEMPMLNVYYEAFRDEGVTILAVNSEEDAATVKQFMQTHGFSMPVLLDSQSDVFALYQATGLPTTVVIDREGRIQYVHTGEITAKKLDAAIRPLL